VELGNKSLHSETLDNIYKRHMI